MGEGVAALLFLLDFAAFTWIAGQVRRRPLPFAAALGLGLLVGWQAIVSVGLSAFTAVNGASLAMAAGIPPLVAIHLAQAGPGGVRDTLARGWRSLRWAFVAYGWVSALVVPLAAVLAVVAASYAPSNWDSMTYHLARVAHWIQQGSVSAYDTNVYRQTVLAPGAEYVLLGLQSVAASDRLANGFQFVAWLAVVGSAAPLARIAGAPRAVASWASPIVAGAPMLVLQATSTQNDLVASALAVAVVTASLPFLHRTSRARPADLALLATMLGAAFLVKASAIVCAAPIIALAILGVVRGMRVWPSRTAVTAVLGAAAITLGIVGPQLARMATADARAEGITAPYVFSLLGEWSARGESVRLAFARHLPANADVVQDLAGRPSALPRFHEDLAANPVQAGFAVAGLLLLVLGWRRLPPRARWGGTAVLASWAMFQATFRPNPWISRLETPLFALLPLTMGSWSAIRNRLARQAILGMVGAASLVLGLVAAVHNAPRPAMQAFSPREEAADYYVNRPDQRTAHEAALDAAAKIGCRRIGLFIGEDSFDYPLTWRAMQRGIEVRHVLGPGPWPCVLVSDRGLPPQERPGEPRWQPVLHVLDGQQANASVVGGVWIRRP
jgi:hypothetical protein